jgi:hypothetical protein
VVAGTAFGSGASGVTRNVAAMHPETGARKESSFSRDEVPDKTLIALAYGQASQKPWLRLASV